MWCGGSEAGEGGGEGRRSRRGASVVPDFVDRSRRHLADHAGGAVLLRSPACGCAGRSGGRRRNGRPRCRLSRGSGCRKARWPGKPARLRNRRQQKTRRRPGFSTVATTRPAGRARRGQAVWSALMRSEEHTSELQSLMRISYAVSCLKKKINTHL